jgi:hypothetical protein
VSELGDRVSILESRALCYVSSMPDFPANPGGRQPLATGSQFPAAHCVPPGSARWIHQGLGLFIEPGCIVP